MLDVEEKLHLPSPLMSNYDESLGEEYKNEEIFYRGKE
jgi:hypothetical protein